MATYPMPQRQDNALWDACAYRDGCVGSGTHLYKILPRTKTHITSLYYEDQPYATSG